MFNPYDQYNQDPRTQLGGQDYMTSPIAADNGEQQQRLAAMLRQGMSSPIQGQSNTPDLSSFETMNKINKGFDTLNGQNAASDYIGEFGKFDPQLQATLGNDATWMQKIGEMF